MSGIGRSRLVSGPGVSCWAPRVWDVSSRPFPTQADMRLALWLVLAAASGASAQAPDSTRQGRGRGTVLVSADVLGGGVVSGASVRYWLTDGLVAHATFAEDRFGYQGNVPASTLRSSDATSLTVGVERWERAGPERFAWSQGLAVQASRMAARWDRYASPACRPCTASDLADAAEEEGWGAAALATTGVEMRVTGPVSVGVTYGLGVGWSRGDRTLFQRDGAFQDGPVATERESFSRWRVATLSALRVSARL